MSKDTYVLRKCIFGRQLDDLDGEHRAKFADLVNRQTEDGGIAIVKVTQLLKRAGFRASTGGLSIHRAQECTCYIQGAQ